MDGTTLVALAGISATAGTAIYTTASQRRITREAHVLEAKLRVYSDCSDALFDFARATFNRVQARLDGQSEAEREPLRQEAYRLGARARSVIGQVEILSKDGALGAALLASRDAVGRLNGVTSRTSLSERYKSVLDEVSRALGALSSELH